MIVTILNIVIAGLLMGGIYALIAVGFSLQYGVARVLNVSHGEFIMLGAFMTWSLYTVFGIRQMMPRLSCRTGTTMSSDNTFRLRYLLVATRW